MAKEKQKVKYRTRNAKAKRVHRRLDRIHLIPDAAIALAGAQVALPGLQGLWNNGTNFENAGMSVSQAYNDGKWKYYTLVASELTVFGLAAKWVGKHINVNLSKKVKLL